MKKLSLVLLLLHCTQISFAQDSIRMDSEFSIETRAQHNLAAFVKDFDCIDCITGQVRDNPFFHLAIYTGIEHKLTLNKKYTLVTGLYLEERSHSGGNNTLSNIVVFPKILIEGRDTLRIFNKNYNFYVKGGDFWNEDVQDILRLYNIDYQAIIAEVSGKNWGFSFMTIGDLSINIGLALPQTYRFGLIYRKESFQNLASLTLNELSPQPFGIHPTDYDINLSNYSKKVISPELNIEGQVDLRLNPELNSGLAVALQANYTESKVTLHGAIRYYTSAYNFGYRSRKPSYTDGRDVFIGDQLYPLKNYYRNYSQWAAYSIYGPTDLLAFVLSSTWEENVYRKLGLFYDIDFNYIRDIDRSRDYLFPIYNAGIQLSFLSNFIGRLSLTNKHMDLNNSYQTFAVSKKPFISFGFSMLINQIRPKTSYIKG